MPIWQRFIGLKPMFLSKLLREICNDFLKDFMFKLNKEEAYSLRSQSMTSSDWSGRRYPAYVFTEQGVAMLSSVLRSPRAIQVNIEIIRAFIRLCQVLVSNVELARKLDALEQKYDAQFKDVFEAIRQLRKPPEPKRRAIGFLKRDK